MVAFVTTLEASDPSIMCSMLIVALKLHTDLKYSVQIAFLNIGRRIHIAPGVYCNIPVSVSFGYIYAGVTLRTYTTTDFREFSLTGGPHGGVVVNVYKRFGINAEGGYRLKQKRLGVGGNFFLATIGLRYNL